MNLRTNDLAATPAKLRAEGRRIAIISVGKLNGEWTVCAVGPRLCQADLDLVSADGSR